jgi:putative spermidine/putrescine transport system ATP-binding protein
MQPELLLLDEPMSNLDAQLREEMHIELRAIQRRLGITTILVTHDQVEAMTMSDRIAVLHRGKLAQLSTPYEAYERPATPFASKFLGRTNVLEGKVVSRNPRCVEIEVSGATLHVPHEGRGVQGSVDVFIRPEKVHLVNGGGRVRGRVVTRVFVGNQWLLEVDSSLGKLRVVQSNYGAPPPEEGNEVNLTWTDDDLRVLARDAQGSHHDQA